MSNGCRFPDFSDKKIVDHHMDRLDTQGVSRRDFLSLASAAFVAGSTAGAIGLPQVAITEPSGKIAYLAWSASTEYNQLVSKGAEAASKVYGFNYALLDGQINAARQLNQFEELGTTHATGGFFNIVDGSAIPRVARLAADSKVFFGASWSIPDWYTPFEAGEYFTLYAVPNEVRSHKLLTAELLKRVTEEFGGGDIAAVVGTEADLVPNGGGWGERARNRGRDLAFADYPKTRLVDQQPGRWLREESLKATEVLLSRNPDIKGIVTQNDDEAQGVLAALRNAGIRGGKEIFVAGNDGTSLAARAIKDGTLLTTSANNPIYTGALFAARLYDVSHGWVPRAAERQLHWNTTILTSGNVDAYLERYVDNGDVEPFDYARLSKVLHPDDWDPQAELFPIDLDIQWETFPKPSGWDYPQAYKDARARGEWEAVKAEYDAHYKIKLDGPSPYKPA